MSDDELSISFASSIGIDNIKEEYLNQSFSDLDQLDNAEFEEYINKAKMKEKSIDDWNNYDSLNNNRATSPGEYFGARSLPLNSVDHVLQKKSNQSNNNTENKKKTVMDGLLESRFKSLPKSIQLFPKFDSSLYTQQEQEKEASVIEQKSIDDSHQQYFMIKPASPLHFLCEISSKTIYAKVIELKIINLSSCLLEFSLFSLKNLIEFETSEGTVLDNETIEIKTKVKSKALLRQQDQQDSSLQDKILVLIDHEHIHELVVYIDFIRQEEDDEEEGEDIPGELLIENRPKCRFCALEKGYPLHSL